MATSVNELPSYIEEKARADRQRHLRVRLLLLLGLLHLVYFLLPLLPFAGTRAVVPALALLPPLFATSYLLMLLLAMRRWWRQRQQATQFVPIPPLEGVS